jgi:protein-S-isoprenylcysteine O-methyltransferase Ste14
VTAFSAAFVWTGGALFVGSLAFCAYTYAITWAAVMPAHPSAVAIDAVLFSAFALHHSFFARDSVKRWLSTVVPEPMLRPVYVWLASTLLIILCAVWQPVGGEVYSHSGVLAIVHALLQLIGVLIIAQSVRMIDPLELAGIRRHPGPAPLQIVGPFRWVRHPLYSGWVLLTFGAAHMTGDRLAFAGISTFYLLIAMPFEERSLMMSFGREYDEYRRTVRYRLIPYVY